MSSPLVAIVGRPNAGKSTLFNRIAGKRLAIVEDEPGTTRDRIYADVTWGDSAFSIVDTGGLVPDADTDITRSVKRQVEIAVDEADAVIFLVDVLDGVTHIDRDIAQMLRRSGKTVVLAANKADNEQRAYQAQQFHELSIGDPLAISAHHNINIDLLLDRVVEGLPHVPSAPEAEMMKVAIVGRPNVGKSMLLNAILGQERAVVNDAPGTTRDAIDTIFEYNGQRMLLIDTAGIRKRGRIEGGIERYSVGRAKRAIDRADVAVLVTDATEPITMQDTHIAGYIQQAFKAMLLVVNKWDLVEKTANRDEYAAHIQQRLKFMPGTPVLFTSASLKQGMEQVIATTRELYQERNKRVPTAVLNGVIRQAVAVHSPPSVKGRKLKVLYVTQAEKSPPTFVFFVNNPTLVHFSYQRYLENTLRNVFGFRGTPLRIIFKGRSEE